MSLAIGVLIGLVLGLTGAGGSVFAVPLLILLGGLPVDQAIGLSLGAVAASAMYGSIRNGRSQQILWTPAIILAATGAALAPLGKWFGTLLPEAGLLIGFNLLAIVIAARMWLGARRDPDAARVVRAGNFSDKAPPELLCRLGPAGRFELRPRCVTGLAVGGGIVGLLSGVFGVGGGFLIVPLLLFLSQINMTQAVATSLLIITAISGTAFVSHLGFSYSAGDAIDWAMLGWIVLGGVGGMFVGQKISHFIANALLQQIFAVSLVTLSLITLASSVVF